MIVDGAIHQLPSEKKCFVGLDAFWSEAECLCTVVTVSHHHNRMDQIVHIEAADRDTSEVRIADEIVHPVHVQLRRDYLPVWTRQPAPMGLGEHRGDAGAVDATILEPLVDVG